MQLRAHCSPLLAPKAATSFQRSAHLGSSPLRPGTSSSPLLREYTNKQIFTGPLQRAARRPRCAPTTTAALAPAAAAAALMPYLPSLLGGLSLGVLAVGKLLVSGRILGISGAVKGVVLGDTAPWRYLFLAGLLAGGVALTALYPAAFEAFPAAISLQRYVASGLLVGVGTSLGNGCTSGHGERGQDLYQRGRRLPRPCHLSAQIQQHP